MWKIRQLHPEIFEMIIWFSCLMALRSLRLYPVCLSCKNVVNDFSGCVCLNDLIHFVWIIIMISYDIFPLFRCVMCLLLVWPRKNVEGIIGFASNMTEQCTTNFRDSLIIHLLMFSLFLAVTFNWSPMHQHLANIIALSASWKPLTKSH